MAEYRIREAEKLGFEYCILPKVCADKLSDSYGMKIIGVRNIREALEYIG